ncbi:MAG: signal peptide peptidase SppA [candidate division Zixibacteria bacterium]|nr:signal peptide peptidase SppA [candidate division Zixibacteria bacterium]
MAEGPGVLRFNPAALGNDQNFGLNYYHTYTDSSLKGDHALYASLRGLGAGVEWLGALGGEAHGRAYTLGFGTSPDHPVRLGSSYQWRSSDDPVQDKSHFWSHGILWRPNNTVSLAAVVDNFNRMHLDGAKSDREFVYSAAVRVFNDHLTVGGDWYQRTSQNLGDGSYRVAASYEVTHGLTLAADIDQQENYFLGARFDLSTWFSGSQTSFDHGSHYRGGIFYSGIHNTRRSPLVSVRHEVAHLDLKGEIPDRRPPMSLFGPTPLTTYDWITLLDKAERDPEIKSVVLHINDPHLGWARLQELRQGLTRVRRAGKMTIAYIEGNASNGEYYLASAADRIVVPPVSTVDVVGLHSEVTFATRLLGKLGIKADLEHVGEYKSASDLVTRTEMSPAHREAVGALLDDLDRQWVGQIAQARDVPEARVREWIDHGPYISIDAKAAGLVDAVAYPDEVDRMARDQAGPIHANVNSRQLAQRRYQPHGWATPPQVAVIFAAGSIESGNDGQYPLIGEVMGSATVSQAIRRARKDRKVKAVVLRIDSGGGSVLAADEIWHEVNLTVGKKPLVVSFADVAASGGYYIACAADSIFALPGTITGSIGVISGKLAAGDLYQKVGLDKEVLTRGRFADMYGSTRPFNDAERAVVRDQITRAYQHFVDLVAQGRRLSPDSVDAIAQGRVWSGIAAQARGLVDRFADLHETIEVAARMARIKKGAEVKVEILPEQRWRLLDAGPLNLLATSAPLAGPAHLLRQALGAIGVLPPAGDDDAAYAMPYQITIQ